MSQSNSINIDGLSLAERLILVQTLWDDIVYEAESLPMTEEKRRWLDARIAAAERPDAVWVSWDEVRAQLRHRSA